MADVRPFRCIRPEVSKASKIAALPYDVVNRNEAKAEIKKELKKQQKKKTEKKQPIKKTITKKIHIKPKSLMEILSEYQIGRN